MRDKFVQDQQELLGIERAAELEQSSQLIQAKTSSASHLEKQGVALCKLEVNESRTGLYGRTVLTLGKAHGALLPAVTISNGDIVALVSGNELKQLDSAPSGVVSHVTSNAIVVSFDESFSEEHSSYLGQDGPFHLIKLANDVTYKRLKSALISISKDHHFATLHQALFANTSLSSPLLQLPPAILHPDHGGINFRNGNLNESQKEAVRFALSQKELAVIHGPPGTGKTTTLLEIIYQEAKCGHKILCCAPSNVAVDNLLDKLSKMSLKVVRLGHPARVNRELQKHSLDALLSMSDQTQLVRDVRSDVDAALCKLKKSRKEGERRSAKLELRELRKELREREQKVIKDILSKADVVLATLTSASPDGPLKHLTTADQAYFDVAVLDECSQSLELACWIALLQCRKAILAGDHKQLPPTIISPEAASKGFSLTLMERIIEQFSDTDVVRMLKIQYRMNQKIMAWSSQHFYDNQLVADESVKSRILCDLPHVRPSEDTQAPLVLIDTSGCDLYEAESSEELSKANEGEVSLVCIHVKSLLESGLSPSEIAVITPYNLQVDLIRLQLQEQYPDLEVKSVDGFQGREKEAVILSLVRSNNCGEVGFLSDTRRLNVAVTRAKRHLTVICNLDTIVHDEQLKSFAQYMNAEAEVRSAMQYEHLMSQSGLVRPDHVQLTLKDEVKKPPPTHKAAKKTPVTATAHKSATIRNNDPAAMKDKSKKQILPDDLASQSKDKIKDDQQERADRKQQLTQKVEDFLRSDKQSMAFSPTLSSFERMLIHEIAEELNLKHESQDQGDQRCLVLAKKGAKLVSTAPKVKKAEASKAQPERKAEASKAQPDKKEPPKVVAKPKSENTCQPSKAVDDGACSGLEHVVCSSCKRKVPKANMTLHKLNCDKAVKSKKAAEMHQEKGKEEEDFDEVVAQFSKMNNKCNFSKCKASVMTLGIVCEFCRAKFCLSHAMPEIHGCGDAARQAARRQLARDGCVYPGSGRPSTLPNPIRRAQLQHKLDKKLTEMSQDRKVKPKKKS